MTKIILDIKKTLKKFIALTSINHGFGSVCDVIKYV